MEVLSNAEQHFLGYKSIAAIENGFKKMIQKGTAILDVGGGNLQISLFDKDALVTTQSLKMGKRAYPSATERAGENQYELCTAGGGVYP